MKTVCFMSVFLAIGFLLMGNSEVQPKKANILKCWSPSGTEYCEGFWGLFPACIYTNPGDEESGGCHLSFVEEGELTCQVSDKHAKVPGVVVCTCTDDMCNDPAVFI